MAVSHPPTAQDWRDRAEEAAPAVAALIHTSQVDNAATATAIGLAVLAELAAQAAPIAGGAVGTAIGGPLGLAVGTALGQMAAGQLHAHTTALAALTPEQQAMVALAVPQVVAYLQEKLAAAEAKAAPVANQPEPGA